MWQPQAYSSTTVVKTQGSMPGWPDHLVDEVGISALLERRRHVLNRALAHHQADQLILKRHRYRLAPV